MSGKAYWSRSSARRPCSARGADGQQTQISINCDFGELGDCGRKRYAIGYERGEYLFDVELSGNRPGAGGSIAINSDFANEGKAVDSSFRCAAPE
jgi:hypothetical protein